MRIISAVVVAAVVGVLAGAAIAYVEVRSDHDALDKLSDAGSPDTTATAEKNSPRILVQQPHYDFGTMQRGTSKSHEFLVQNVGAAPLKLRNGGTTCKCTMSQVPESAIPPGGSTKIKLEWKAKVDQGPFRQTATILTNDPTQSQVELSVDGQVLPISGVEPPDFLFDKISVGETKSAHVYVMAMLQDTLTVTDPQFSDPTVRGKFNVDISRATKSELPNKNAKQGVRVTVTALPNLPVGRLATWLTLHTNLPDAEKLDIPLIGQVVGDISVSGITGWNEDEGVLVIGSVKSSEGGHGKVNLIVRGPDAENVKFGVKSVIPKELKVTIGKPQKLRDELVHVPVDIEIPPGTPPMVHLDTAQGDAAHIVFSTTHPKIKELSLPVRFAVER
ncbi:MAG TPA: DUF1573 domain-containing protein [Lacipirellulaceae bacterium]|nr:DUF1573 domain-containing protein [Lacipirellulaceae bacterium]